MTTTPAIDDSKLDLQALLDTMQREFDYTWAHVPTMRTGEAYRTGFGGWLIVNTTGYGIVPTEDVLNGVAPVIEALLTEDGRWAKTTEWHEGPTYGDSVYVERWTQDGRQFHGYVDSESRKVVQVG